MASSFVASKGQVTIPGSLRENLRRFLSYKSIRVSPPSKKQKRRTPKDSPLPVFFVRKILTAAWSRTEAWS